MHELMLLWTTLLYSDRPHDLDRTAPRHSRGQPDRYLNSSVHPEHTRVCTRPELYRGTLNPFLLTSKGLQLKFQED